MNVEKSYLVQKFARLNLGTYHVIGYSVAGEESVVQVPEMNVCFDFGRAPQFALTSDIVCLTHGHMDHLAGLPYYLSQRYFQGMRAGTVLVPREIEKSVDGMLKCWRDVERQGTPYKLVPISAGQTYPVRRDFAIRAYQTHHGGPSVGYGLISVREKLKPEYADRTGPQLVDLKKAGVEIQYRVEVPMVVYLGDTTAGAVFDEPDVINAETLITECTFYEDDHRGKAKAGRHLHVDHFAPIVERLNNKQIILTHVSRRTGIRRARNILRRRVGDAAMERITFLMDFDGATDGGDVDALVPHSAEDAAVAEKA